MEAIKEAGNQIAADKVQGASVYNGAGDSLGVIHDDFGVGPYWAMEARAASRAPRRSESGSWARRSGVSRVLASHLRDLRPCEERPRT